MTLSCSSLPLSLGAGAVQCSDWAFRLPKPKVMTQWLGSCEIGRKSQLKEVETRNAPNPKAFTDRTPDVSPHHDGRKRTQTQLTEDGPPQNMRRCSQNSERQVRILKGLPTPFGHGPKGTIPYPNPKSVQMSKSPAQFWAPVSGCQRRYQNSVTCYLWDKIKATF